MARLACNTIGLKAKCLRGDPCTEILPPLSVTWRPAKSKEMLVGVNATLSPVRRLEQAMGPRVGGLAMGAGACLTCLGSMCNREGISTFTPTAGVGDGGGIDR
jgi:hypothetical protein